MQDGKGEVHLTELAAIVHLAAYREKYDVVPDALLQDETEERPQRIARRTRERIARKHELCVTYGAIDIVTAVIRRHTSLVSTSSCDGNNAVLARARSILATLEQMSTDIDL